MMKGMNDTCFVANVGVVEKSQRHDLGKKRSWYMSNWVQKDAMYAIGDYEQECNSQGSDNGSLVCNIKEDPHLDDED